MDEDANVKVFCRVRPPNERECGVAQSTLSGSAGLLARASASSSSSFAKKCVSVPRSDAAQQTLFLHSKHGLARTFTFDRVFAESATQTDVFRTVGAPITQACLEGYNGTIFAYGQTGSGKTFTMQGPDDVIDTDNSALTQQQLELRGLVPRVFDYLFQNALDMHGGDSVQHVFKCSFLEIYNERVYDLLDGGSTKDPAGLQLRENGRKGVHVEGLIESVVTSSKKAAELMTVGAQNRRVGQTSMNRESSRSHSVFILQLQTRETSAEGTKIRTSRFNLVDLAGSERQRSTDAAGERLKEAGSINKSLSALGNVIMGLSEQSVGKHRHVHYRDSKLTFLLKDSLGGNSKTFMIATISPAEDSAFETLSTLKFAQRAKMIQNSAVINEDSIGNVSFLQEEVQRLRLQLQQARQEIARNIPGSNLLQDRSALSQASEHSSSSGPLGALGDTVIDSRFRELEESFAAVAEKNDRLLRSCEYLQLQNGNFQALCTELKQHIAHLKLMLRMRGIDSSEYEPSADAVEWRMKYEEMEEQFAELQDEFERSGVAESLTGKAANKVENLNMMLLGLTNQLAFVLRDKHDLQDRLLETQSENMSGPAAQESVDADFSARLGEALKQQANEYQAKLESAETVSACLEEKAAEMSLELLQLKQRDESWSIRQHDLEKQLADSRNALKLSEEAQISSYDKLVQEKLKIEELALQLQRTREGIRLEFEATLADATAAKRNLEDAKTRTETQLQAVTAELKKTELQLQDSENSFSQLKDGLCQLEEAHQATESELAQVKGELKGAVTQVVNMRGELADRDVAIENLQQIEGKLRDDTLQFQQKLEEANASIDQLKRDADITAEKHTELIKNRQRGSEEQMRTLTKDFENRLQVKSEQFQQLRIEFDDFQTKAREAARQHNLLVEEKDTSFASLQQQLASQKQDSEVAMEKMREKLADTQSDLTKLFETKSQVESELVSASQDILRLRGDVKQFQLERESMASEVQRLLERADQTSTESSILREQKDALEKKCEELLDQSSTTENTIKNSIRHIEELQQQLSTKSSEMDVLREELGSAKEAAREAAVAHAEELASQFSVIEDLKQELAAKADAMGEMSAKLDQAESEIRGTEGTVGQQRGEIEMYKGIQSTLRDEVRKLEFDRLELSESVKTEQESKHELELKFVEAQRAWENEKTKLTEEFDASIMALEKRVEELTLTIDTMSSQKHQLENKNDDLKNSIVEHETSMLALKNCLAERDDKIRALESCTADATTIQGQLADTVAGLRERLCELEHKLADQQSLVSKQEADLHEKMAVVCERDSTIQSLKEWHESAETAWGFKSGEYKTEVEAANGRVQALEQLLAEKTAVFAKAEEAFATERQVFNQKLLEAEEGAAQHSDQLAKEIKQLEASITEKDEQLQSSNSSVAELNARLNRLNRSAEETSNAKVKELQTAIEELAAKQKLLLAENAELKENSELTSKLKHQEEELNQRRDEIEAAENQLVTSRKALDEDKAAVETAQMEAKTKKMAQDAFGQAKHQFLKDKVKLQREVQTLTKKLESATKENEKLVGHHNSRQKIQHHVKVKEENNRLLERVRQLTEEKFKLSRSLEKLQAGFKEKEKENIGVEARPNTPSAAPSVSSSSTVPKKVRTSLGSASASTASSAARSAATLPKRPSLGSASSSRDNTAHAAKAARIAALARPRPASAGPSKKRMRTHSSSSTPGWQR